MNRVVGEKTGRRFLLDARALIGRGVEGKVYRCGDEAVKILDAPPGPGDGARMAALSSLSAKVPGFAWPTEPVVDPSTGGVVGFAMPLAEGGTLEAMLDARSTSRLAVETKATIGFRIAGAVAVAHANRGPKVALGDVLKAGNVVVDSDRVVLVDAASASLFGYRDESGDARDAVNSLVTPGYSPKEVLETPGALPGEATDRYALAVVLFELFFGRSPHDVRPCPAAVGLGPDEAIRRGVCPRYVQDPEFDPPTYDPVDPPAEVEQLFRAALLTVQRPSAAEWCRALEAWLDSLRPAPPPAPRRRRRPRWIRRLDPVSAAFVLIVLLGCAAKLAWSAYATPGPAPSVPATEIGPPLFQEIFK